MLRCSGGVVGRSHRAHCAGFRVIALMALMAAVAAITSANWRYICPLKPGRKAAGTNTAISTSVMPMMGPEQLVHGLDGRVVRGEALLDVLCRALHDHDRVVDDDADGENDGEQASSG